MVICPNCKFQQPKDLFCAKCGIDLNVPQDRSLIQKVTESTGFYIVLLCCVVLVTTFFAYKKVLVHLEEESNTPSSNLDYTATDSIPPPNKNPQELEISSETIQPQDFFSQNAFTSKEILPSNEDEKKDKTEDKSEDKTKIDTFSSGVIKVYFLIMPNDITSLQTAELQSGQYGIISDFAGSFESIPDENKNILLQSSWQVSPSASPQSREFSIRSRENNTFGQIGISTEITLNEISEASAMLQSNIDTVLLEGTETNARRIEDIQTFNQITLNRGNAIFIFSLLPHRPPSNIERTILPQPLLSAMGSESFLEGLTELFVIIEYSL